jgi:hypothetical protein
MGVNQTGSGQRSFQWRDDSGRASGEESARQFAPAGELALEMMFDYHYVDPAVTARNLRCQFDATRSDADFVLSTGAIRLSQVFSPSEQIEQRDGYLQRQGIFYRKDSSCIRRYKDEKLVDETLTALEPVFYHYPQAVLNLLFRVLPAEAAHTDRTRRAPLIDPAVPLHWHKLMHAVET